MKIAHRVISAPVCVWSDLIWSDDIWLDCLPSLNSWLSCGWRDRSLEGTTAATERRLRNTWCSVSPVWRSTSSWISSTSSSLTLDCRCVCKHAVFWSVWIGHFDGDLRVLQGPTVWSAPCLWMQWYSCIYTLLGTSLHLTVHRGYFIIFHFRSNLLFRTK